MNKKKIIAMITMVTLVITSIVPILGANGDGVGSADWPGTVNVTNASIETENYTLDQVKEMEVTYSPKGKWDVTRHISITGAAEVSDVAYYENNQWNTIDTFEKRVTINTSTAQKIRMAFQEEGKYTINIWLTSDAGERVNGITKNIYVSNEGIFIVPPTPTELAESVNKLVFQWKGDSGLIGGFNFYIDGIKVNEEVIAKKQVQMQKFDASAYQEKFTPGEHMISVTSVGQKSQKAESEPISVKYVVEAPTTEETSTVATTTEPVIQTTTESVAQTTTESVVQTTTEPVAQTTTESVVQTTTESVIQTTTKEQGTEDTATQETATDETESTTDKVVTDKETTTAGKNETTTTERVTTKAAKEITEGVQKPARVKIKSATKKKATKIVKIKLKKVNRVAGYQIQICKNKKFKKKNTITKNVKKLTVKIKKLESNAKYYVRARAFVINKNVKFYGNWSKKVKVKIKK